MGEGEPLAPGKMTCNIVIWGMAGGGQTRLGLDGWHLQIRRASQIEEPPSQFLKQHSKLSLTS